jgi:D-alanyl-D-alanine carboxypeptidase (penicillin-binding protein 5/6)
MRLFLISVKQLRWMAGILIGMGMTTLGHWLVHYYYRGVVGPYLVRRIYPPLVFLPKLQKAPPVSAGAAVLIEGRSGAVLYAKNPEIRRAPASTTKIMTAIVTLEKGNLRQIVQVSRRAAVTGGSTLWLKPGDRLVLKELLEGVMLRSGNDGSMAVAEAVAGSVAKFVRLMNLKAKEIGALRTNFRNPHGLRAPSHYTTALDLALITRYGLADRRFANLVKTREATLEWFDDARKIGLKNTNRLLWSLQGVDGVKTGTTNEAGHCLVASATRDGKQLIAVVLKSCNRWRDCTELLEYGFANFSLVKIADPRQVAGRIKINKRRSWLSLYPRHALWAVVEKGNEKRLHTELVIWETSVKPPLKVGRALGRIGYRYEGQLVEGVDLINRTPVSCGWRWW